MAPLKIKHAIHFCRKGSLDWKVDISGEIPPSDDALKIQFAVFREIEHAYGPDSSIENNVVLEHISTLQSTYKAITIRPSELCSEDTTSIMQSYSVRLIVDFINTHYPPLGRDSVLSIMVAKIIEYVQNSTAGSIPLPPNRMLFAGRRQVVRILHIVNDQVRKERLLRHFEDTKRGTCAICMDDFEVGIYDFEVGSYASRLPCLHIFHRHCIVEWLVIKNRCPICRYSVLPKMVTLF
ncbi:hypothetical protein M0R45_036725 [Rubus argutus]|uniref:RING-type domain-containing protein n=1 Tax=Rubus argutus TaxID=59490 RepID=A0AAW1W0R4_RUBAR